MGAALIWKEGLFAGVRTLTPRVIRDERGCFIKTFHQPSFSEVGINFVAQEEYYTISRSGVIRGMHFQIPPLQHAKLVKCLRGAALDVLLDLRPSEPTFGQTCSFELTEDNAAVVYIPPGVAHGFLARVDGTLMHYQTSSVHSPEHDRGVRWDSFGFVWPATDPVLSPRDQSFPSFAEFSSPF